jgi:MFS family permease
LSLNDPAQEAPPQVKPLDPLRQPVYRNLWLVWLAANLCMWMNDVTAAWLMTQLTDSPLMVALVATAATLPVFVLGLPSGAIADIVDRRRWFMAGQVWVAGTALVLALTSAAGALSPPLLLALVLANGVGLASRWPVFAAIVPEVVPRRELSAALALNGVSMNLSRIVGPLLAGTLIAASGPAVVFALNAVLALVSIVVIYRWKYERRASALPGERFVGAMRVGLQYVRQSQPMRVVLLRTFVFFMHSVALTALLPLVARAMGQGGAAGGGAAGGGAGTFTLLIAAMGFGAIVAALGLAKLRARIEANRLINLSVATHAVAVACVATVAWMPWPAWVVLALALVAMALAGAGWITVANSMAVAAQSALPDWVRARGMSLYQMALMGGAASGSALWGYLAGWIGVRGSLMASCAVAFLLLALLRDKNLTLSDSASLAPSHPFAEPQAAYELARQDQPVMVMIEYLVDEGDAAAFVHVMRDSRRSRLQLGALSWGLYRDTTDPKRFVESYVDENWTEHLRRFDRTSDADRALRDRRLAFHRGDNPPKVTRMVGQSLELE